MNYLLRLCCMYCLASSLLQAQVPVPQREHLHHAEGKSKRNAVTALRHNERFTLASAKNYDVLYYDIHIALLPGGAILTGRVAMRLRSLIQNLETIDYDFYQNGIVDSVFVNGTSALFTHSGNVVSVQLNQPMNQGNEIEIATVYSSPTSSGAIFSSTVTNVVKGTETISFASHAEPYDARKWWPCKDDPEDKADSVDITITTKSGYTVVANGIELSDTENPDSTHTVHWKSLYPIATYLVSFAACDYNINEYIWNYEGHSMPYTTWYFRNTQEEQQQHDSIALTSLTLFSDLFGAYPFLGEKYGMAETTYPGATEHQTVTSMGIFTEHLTVHELAHQWFGDKVTCADFGHIWLNEGWATYSEALYRESLGGYDSLLSWMDYYRYYGEGNIYIEGAEMQPFLRIFDHNLTYGKAAWVVHMLRGVVGDSAFFRATRRYLGGGGRQSYRSVQTDDLRDTFEAESGMDLDYFFDEWIYGEYYPTYKYGWNSVFNGQDYTTTLNIEQLYISTRPLFTMPIRVLFRFAQRDSVLTVWNNQVSQTYKFTFASQPVSITLDPDDYILKQIEREPDPMTNGDYPHTILLVNGTELTLSADGTLLRDALRNSVFTAEWPFQFYDLYPVRAQNYPENIVNPNGSLALPLAELQKFCTVVWISSGNESDIAKWRQSPMLEYVKRGGNLVLITLNARSFIDEDFRSFLGISWIGKEKAHTEMAVSHHPSLVDMEMIQQQTPVAVMRTSFSNSTTSMLFTDDSSYHIPVCTGIWSKPCSTEFGKSGHVVFFSMAGHWVQPGDLRHNLTVLLDSIMCANQTGLPVIQSPSPLALEQNYPNPVPPGSASRTAITFTLGGAIPQHVAVSIYDPLGRLVAVPIDATLDPGRHSIDVRTEHLAPGTYMYRLTSNGNSVSRVMTVVK